MKRTHIETVTTVGRVDRAISLREGAEEFAGLGLVLSFEDATDGVAIFTVQDRPGRYIARERDGAVVIGVVVPSKRS